MNSQYFFIEQVFIEILLCAKPPISLMLNQRTHTQGADEQPKYYGYQGAHER